MTNMLDQTMAAIYLGVSPGTLAVWRSTGRYTIPFVKVGRAVRYDKTELDLWMKSREQTSTKKAA